MGLASNKIEQGDFHEVLILKTALTAVLIGTYALSVKRNNRWLFPTEKALQVSSVLVWGAQVWNAVNYLFEIAESAG